MLHPMAPCAVFVAGMRTGFREEGGEREEEREEEEERGVAEERGVDAVVSPNPCKAPFNFSISCAKCVFLSVRSSKLMYTIWFNNSAAIYISVLLYYCIFSLPLFFLSFLFVFFHQYTNIPIYQSTNH
jgi:hypothetical protein